MGARGAEGGRERGRGKEAGSGREDEMILIQLNATYNYSISVWNSSRYVFC